MSTLSNHQLLAECSEIRCICHIDLDCFYCQVEHKRLGIPASVPLAVQQWQGLIAVNYAARAANVKRHESIHEALKKCPELRLVHVATYSDVDVNPDYHPDPSPLTHKVSLEPYRRASADIFKIISRFSPKYQKASVDEGYLDLTQEIIKSILDSPPKNITFDDWEGTFVIGDNANQTWANYALYLASKKIRQIRECIFGELSFTCSAGIAHNKTLAKLCSSKHKPNKQTLLPLEATSTFLDPLSISSIPHLGGKLGFKVMECLNVTNCGELRRISIETLCEHFDPQTAHWLLKISQGICDKKVIERSQSKSMMAAKSLRSTVTNFSEAFNWLSMLCNELWVRVRDDADLNCRWPSTLTLTVLRKGEETSQSCSFPPKTSLKASPEALITKAKTLLSVPCSRIMVQCSGFHKLSSNSIESWLQSGNNANKNVLKSITPEASPFTKQSYSDSNQVEIFKLENEAQSSIDKAKMISPCFLNSVGTSDVSKKVSRPLLEKSNPFNRIKRKKSTESVSNQSKISFFMNVAEPNTNSQSKVLLSPDQMLKKMPNETIEDSGRLSSSELIELQKCKECKEMFPRVGMQEHMDWHFAMKLQKHG